MTTASVRDAGSAVLRGVQVRTALPKGGSLATEIWAVRRRAVVVLLALHSVGMFCFGLAMGESLAHSFFETTPIVVAVFVLAASVALLTAWRLHERTFFDSLTGLANRRLFEDRVARVLRRHGGRDGVAVLFLDLDDFKTVNDSLGHGAGDELLVSVARRIAACVRGSDAAARLGGDEFAVLLAGADERAAAAAAERLLAALREPFLVGGQEIFTGASIGVAIGESGRHAGELLRDADAAMYEAKRGGKRRWTTFERSMHTEVVERLELRGELARAVERNELRVHYQPLVDFGTGRVVGVEALVRWQHPERGLVPPLEFIEAAEETGLIVPIGGFVLEEACAQVRAWQLEAPDEPRLALSVNVSPRQLREPTLAADVRHVLSRTGLDPRDLVLELTENVLLADREDAAGVLGSLSEIGVRLALDDFGTGYSSLIYLHRFPFDVLKIDRTFVENVAEAPEALAIARAIVQLGHPLGLEVTAEGVETAAQLAALRLLGCESGQGYHFSPPLPPAELEALLAAQREEARAAA